MIQYKDDPSFIIHCPCLAESSTLLHTACCTLEIAYCKLNIGNNTQNTAHCILYTAYCTLNRAHFILHTTSWTLPTKLYIQETEQGTLHPEHYTLNNIRWTLYPENHTINTSYEALQLLPHTAHCLLDTGYWTLMTTHITSYRTLLLQIWLTLKTHE